MRLTFILTVFLTMNLWATVYSQKTMFTLGFKGKTVKEVFSILEKQSDFRFFYNEDFKYVSKTVDLAVQNKNIEQILDKIFAQSDITYKILENNLVVLTIKPVAKQNIVVKGSVVDGTTQEPIPGVNIMIEGANKGAITDLDGKFSIEVPSAESVLRFSFIGYETESIVVGSNLEMNVALRPALRSLNEVVVIGYGQTKKKDLSVAVSSVKMDENIKGRATDVMGMLQGQMPGVTITQNGGDPLASSSITIRGRGQRDGESPLFVVDGVPGAPYNTSDIETITVLKDAASAAIYGASVGSGGVVIITTKSAKAGKVKIDANVYRGWQSAWNIPESLTAEEYNKVAKDAAANGNGKIPGVTDANIYPYGQTTRTNWTDAIFRMAKKEHYAVSLTGGNETFKGFASMEYDNNEGVLLNTYSKKLGAKANLDFKISDKVQLSQTINFSYQNGQGGVNTSSHTGVITAAMFMPSSAPIYESTGVYSGTVPSQYGNLGVAGDYGEVQNPVATLLRLDQYRPSQNLFSTTSLTYKPISALTIKSTFSARSNNSRYEDFSAKITEIGKTNLENSRTLSSSESKYWLWENLITYNKTFDDLHNVTLMAGSATEYNNYRGFDLTVYNFPDENEYSRSIVNGTDWTKTQPSESSYEASQVSSFGRLSYAFADKYFLTTSLRYDVTSKLLEKNSSDLFSAVSGAWKVSSEKFFADNISFISLLKLRASWGQIGNVGNVPMYRSKSVNLAQDGDFTYLGLNGQTQIKGLALTTLLNQDLEWETTEQTDLGADINILNDKLNIVFDYYKKVTKDMIDLVPMPSVAGIQTLPYGNIGKVTNEGYELSATYTNKIGELNFSIGGNYAYTTNEVNSLGNQDYMAHSSQIRTLYPFRSTVGQPWYSYYLIQTDGLFQTQEEVDNYTYNGVKIQPNAKPGDLKYKDISGPNGKPDGVINNYDKVYCGSYTPKHTYSLNISADFRGFDFSLQLQGVSGLKIFNGFKQMTMEGTQGWNYSKDVLSSWTYDKSSSIPRVTNSDPNKNYSTESDYFLEDGSYMRIKNITLGYTVPAMWMNQIGFKECKLRVYLSGENVLTMTKYGGMDPEIGGNGLDGGRYPVARVFSVGANLNF
jgi:TonB-linked SusC/RagA family outer membrane protein